MAALSTLGGSLTGAMQDVRAFGEEPPILDKIRAKRMEREKLDLEAEKVKGQNAAYAAQAEQLKAKADQDATLKAALQSAPKIDQSSPEAFTQSIQSYVTYMYNNGYPDIAKDTLTHLDNLPNIMQPGARTERAETMEAERTLKGAQTQEAQARAQQLGVTPKRAFEAVGPDETGVVADLVKQYDPAYKDYIPFNEPRDEEIRRMAQQAVERLQFYQAEGIPKTLEEVFFELNPQYAPQGQGQQQAAPQQQQQPAGGRAVVDRFLPGSR